MNPMMHVSMMHVSIILDPDAGMYDAYPILLHVTMMIICMMHFSMMHVSMMHVSMVLDPDTCMYDAYPILIHVTMMHIYVRCIYP